MKQRENAKSKTNPTTQERLTARERYQYVTRNPRIYGTVSTQDQRKLTQAMASLQINHHKRQAKLRSQIYETKVRRWNLKEKEETTCKSNVALPEDITPGRR